MRKWPETDAEWEELFKKREMRALKSPVERFFFELDRATEPGLMKVNPALSAVDRAARESGWRVLSDLLGLRIEQRFSDGRTSVRIDPAIVRGFSKIVTRSAKALPTKSPFSKVMPDFGAGALGRTILIGSGPSAIPIAICDADSYYLWFFAEFGLAAIEFNIQKAFWVKAMKPLIHAAYLFSRRFPEGVPMQLFNYPGPPLTAAERKALSDDFGLLWSGAGGNPAQAMAMALRASAPCYRC